MSRKIPETITEQEFKEIIKKVKNPKKRLAYGLGFYQCMRVSEVVGLQPEHIDQQRKLIMIKQAKGKKDRNIPIAPELMRGMRHIPVKGGVRSLQISFKRISMKILHKDLHFHTLRHSGATHYLNVKKWNLRMLQNFLGHADISCTQIYTHVNDQDMQKVMWG